VLYSLEDDSWKLADFGATAEGTSKGEVTTVYSRGTPSYRAPELLKEAPFYNRKSDIWAVGCIFYELAAGEKAFNDDFAVQMYAMRPSTFRIPKGRFTWTISHSAGREDMEKLIARMLAIDYKIRPSSLELQGVCPLGNSFGNTDSTNILSPIWCRSNGR